MRDTTEKLPYLPSSVIAITVTLAVSSWSDYIRLKYLLYMMGTGSCLALIGMIYLGQLSLDVWLLGTVDILFCLMILGNGIMMGLYSVILSVTWPRFFGKTHLGAISGRAITFVVFGSAIGPILFSESLSLFGDYYWAGWCCFALFFGLTIASIWANNPQEKLRKTNL
ncbi:hypothetical protein N6H18_06100 [Reichenbachiella agarivorans]|uniref:Major Facilitator Superfamily protein n=1 Tax=Reichenbachiella agarivorans TaxID=2979464 RepID=A0ABY6CUF4_9BACT|nr:hypothetical protein [Reichenbachiella agarivorans]UXP33524.1 hypothetical protein N6H18_06100 [Reichenbachiella agarivorans]